MDGRVGFRRETGHRNQVSVHRFLKIAVKPLIRHLPAASLQLCVQHPVELRETLVEMALAVNHVGSSRIVNKKKKSRVDAPSHLVLVEPDLIVGLLTASTPTE